MKSKEIFCIILRKSSNKTSYNLKYSSFQENYSHHNQVSRKFHQIEKNSSLKENCFHHVITKSEKYSFDFLKKLFASLNNNFLPQNCFNIDFIIFREEMTQIDQDVMVVLKENYLRTWKFLPEYYTVFFLHYTP